MVDLILTFLLLVIIYFLWTIRRGLVHMCVQLGLLCKFTEAMKCHLTATEPDPDDDITKILSGHFWINSK